MRFPVISFRFLPAAGMALFPFILVKRTKYKNNKAFINHEKIHLVQQLELLILGFYVLYLLNYLVNLFKYKNHQKAYLNIIFEREAYSMESDLSYLKRRKLWQWRVFY
jgi:hypothetical protein